MRNPLSWLKSSSVRQMTLPQVCVKDTGTAKGRGVYALRDFQAGEIVELCPVIVLEMRYPDLPGDLQCIVFRWSENAVPTATADQALVLGYGSIYNHDNPSNLRFELDKSALMIRFIARRLIIRDEELTINYDNGKKGEATPEETWWFAAKKIEPILD